MSGKRVVTRRQTIDAAYTDFMETRYWAALDGLRALSIMLVLTAHMHDHLWDVFNGSLGVTLFFVISGFLITSLALREEQRNGRLSLSSFYIKRVYRIVPLYFLALALFTLLVVGLGLGQGGTNFLQRLPLLATFNGEFAGTGTFSHSWSLGIEEKFYIIWPLLAFGAMALRRLRAAMLWVLVPAAAGASFVPEFGYFGIYFPILLGCAMALAANSRRTFPVIYALSRPFATIVLFTIMLVAIVVEWSLPFEEASGYSHTAFAAVVIFALPGIVNSPTGVSKLFAHPLVAHYGTLAYAIYLFHPLCLEVVDMVIEPGTGAVVLELARFLAVLVSSYVLARILQRFVEKPCIDYGRSLAKRTVQRKSRQSDLEPAK